MGDETPPIAAPTEQATVTVTFGKERCPALKGNHWCTLEEGHQPAELHESGLNGQPFTVEN